MYTLMDQYDETTGKFGLPHTTSAMNSYLQQAEFRNTDWFDLLFNDNIMQNHSVSVSTGTDKANLYASLSAMLDPGWTKSSQVQRYTANVNASFNLSKQITLTLRSKGFYVDQDSPGTLSRNVDPVSGEVRRDFDINPFSYALNTARTLDPDETYTRNYAPFNIFKELENNYIKKQEKDINFQAQLNYKPILGLEIDILGSYRAYNASLDHYILNESNQAEAYRAGVDNPNIRGENPYLYTDPDKTNTLPISVMPTGGIFIQNLSAIKQMDFRGTIQYNHVWQVKDVDTHIFNALAGMEANRLDREQS